ncbi:MAG: membrane protein insertase YidC, partial [Alphaproteobacteria bacterium]|nr:membrane protein insertase YidC [Alphaproteobacteria bacterium]
MKSQEPDNHSNLLIAVALSTIVVMGWQYFYISPQIEKQRERARLEQVDKTNAPGAKIQAPSTDIGTPTAPAASGTTPAKGAAASMTRDAAIANSNRIAIETPSLTGSISLKGALIDDLTLTKYKVTSDPTSKKVTLFSPPGAPDAYFSEHGWKPTKAGVKVPNSDSVWQASRANAKLTSATPVTLTWSNNAGLTFKRK